MKLTKTREQLVEMYLNSLKEEKIPWKKEWNSISNINAITGNRYKGINYLILSLVSSLEGYDDPRWCSFVQIKKMGWKLRKEAKGKGVPIEFWSCYNIKTKKKLDFKEYEEYIKDNPSETNDFKVFSKCTYVYNAKYIEGIPEYIPSINSKKILIPKYISNIIKNIGVGYKEEGIQAYYNPLKDEIVIPRSENFNDKYSYYATQLHELCHSTGNVKRLNRHLENNNKIEYAREELVAEIGSSFLMQNLNVFVDESHYENHKSYIQSWIQILENKPQELFDAISKANKVYDYLDSNSKDKIKDLER